MARREQQEVRNRHANLLLVEGISEKFTIPYLVGNNGVKWVIDKDNKKFFAYIDDYGGGKDKIVKSPVISAELNVPGRKALGLIVDADSNCASRWQGVRDACKKVIPDLPKELPETGLIHDARAKDDTIVKFGVWIMPDNQNRGMFETFLHFLIDDEHEPLWQYAQETAAEAKNRGADYKAVHSDKAKIHTWLAWKDEPGNQLHIAVKEKMLNPQHPKSKVFMKWFKNLYSLT